MSQTASSSGDDVPHPYYTESSRKSFPSQQDVADAWAEGQYPTHNETSEGAVLYTGSPTDSRYSDADGRNTNFYGVQESDGSGVLWHYDTREAIRLQDGTVISNQQCWSAGFAHCSNPDYDYEVPLSAVEEHLERVDGVFDIVDVWGQPSEETVNYSYMDEPETRNYTRARHSIVVIQGGENRYGVYIGRDSSIINSNSHFTFKLSDDELALIDEPTDALDLLKPHEVHDSDLDVVASDEYTRTRGYNLSEEELESHKEAGGSTVMVENRYRDDEEQIRQHFRANLQGEVIVRHGEFFLIPTDKDLEEEEYSSYARDQLGSHRPERHGGAVVDMEECPNCGSTSWGCPDGDKAWLCSNCGRNAPVFVRGEIRHDSNDHNAVNLGETWHLAVSHDRDVRTYDDNPSQGGGGGWD